MSNTDKMTDFEDSLTRLEQIVSNMERGELSLEQSLEAFEEGVKLTKECQTKLKNAEQRVSVLLEQDEALHEKPFLENDQD